jgi:hypothetical protein
VDETDSGYYVLDNTGSKAIFLPRTTVLLVYFSDTLPDPQLVELGIDAAGIKVLK